MKHSRRALVTIVFITALMSNAMAEVKEGVVQCANLIYAGSHTSRCFSDEFLRQIERESSIRTARRFVAVKLSSDEVFTHPFVVMTGEGPFVLAEKERIRLRSHLTRGGFLLASAGCSSEEWDESFRREMKLVFGPATRMRKAAAKNEEQRAAAAGEGRLQTIPSDHPVFSTIREIESLPLKGGGTGQLEGVSWNGKLVVIYSSEGLNDTANTSGCCCCGGNEVSNAADMNMNILAYVMLR